MWVPHEVGNLQVVTRAANVYESASDEADWAMKAEAMTAMAMAMQDRRKAVVAALRAAALRLTRERSRDETASQTIRRV